MVEQSVYTGKVGGSNPSSRTSTELIDSEEANVWACRRHAHGFCICFAGEFGKFGALARTVFSPRERFEIPCDTNSVFALDTKRIFARIYLLKPIIR